MVSNGQTSVAELQQLRRLLAERNRAHGAPGAVLSSDSVTLTLDATGGSFDVACRGGTSYSIDWDADVDTIATSAAL